MRRRAPTAILTIMLTLLTALVVAPAPASATEPTRTCSTDLSLTTTCHDSMSARTDPEPDNCIMSIGFGEEVFLTFPAIGTPTIRVAGTSWVTGYRNVAGREDGVAPVSTKITEIFVVEGYSPSLNVSSTSVGAGFSRTATNVVSITRDVTTAGSSHTYDVSFDVSGTLLTLRHAVTATYTFEGGASYTYGTYDTMPVDITL